MAASVIPAAWAMSRTLARAVPFSENSWSAASRICLRVSGPRRSLRERPEATGAGTFLAVTKGRNLASLRFSLWGASGRCQFERESSGDDTDFRDGFLEEPCLRCRY